MIEWNAVQYAAHSSLQQAMAEEQLSQLDLGGTEAVLDIGCGDGKITAAIATRLSHGSVLGIDPSRDMIAFASTRFGPSYVPNLRFECGDVRFLPYRHRFDLVVSFNALHWVPEQNVALRSISTALKPNGKAFLRFVSKGKRKSLEEVFEETCLSAKWTGYFQAHVPPFIHVTPEAFRTLAASASLRILDLHVEDKIWNFQNREAFTAFCRATFMEWTQALPDDRRDVFINEVLDAYRIVAADNAEEANTFKFYQMATTLAPIIE